MVNILENMIEILLRIFFIFIFLFSSIAYSQTLFIPISDPYIISIYKTGEKSQDGTYISKDSLGNIRIKGKFNGIKAIELGIGGCLSCNLKPFNKGLIGLFKLSLISKCK